MTTQDSDRKPFDVGMFPVAAPDRDFGADRVGMFTAPISAEGNVPKQFRVGIRRRAGETPEILHLITHTTLTDASQHAESLKGLVSELALSLNEERNRDLRFGEQLVVLRDIALRISDHLGMLRSLVDSDLGRTLPYLLEHSQEGDRIALLFYPGFQRVVMAGVTEGQSGFCAFDALDLQGFANSGITPAGYILIRMESTGWVRFSLQEVCAPPLVDALDASRRAHQLLGLSQILDSK